MTVVPPPVLSGGLMADRPLTLGLVQINNSFSGQNYLPYSIGLLQAYIQARAANPDRYRFLLPVYKRLHIDDLVRHLQTADIVAFSVYVWNERISLETARRLKKQRPDRMIVFGGPQVPDAATPYLDAHPFIDVLCHGEGERVFCDLMENTAVAGENNWQRVSGISWRARPGKEIRRTARGGRPRDIADLPSPYLSGTFDPLIAAQPEESWIALWETNRGCPFQCTFCDWGSATQSKVHKFQMARLEQEIEWFAARRIEFVFCCDANFGILHRDVDIANKVADIRARTGYPHALSVQNTKNATERAYVTQKVLADAGLNKGVTLSLQSTDLATLEAVKRSNISLETFEELQRRFTHDHIETYSDVILGLPGETLDSFVGGIAQLISNGQHNRIQFNNLSILPNAEMGDPAYQKRFGLETVETDIINMHGARHQSTDGIVEVQKLVVGTTAMPPRAWVRGRATGWMVAFLHFDKILQIANIITHELAGVPYRAMIDAWMSAGPGPFPLLAGIRDWFMETAESIQAGGPEYVHSPHWLDIYWPADEYQYIRLAAEDRLEALYAELEALLLDLAGRHDPDGAETVICDAVRLNAALLKRPFIADEISVACESDVLAFYRGIRNGDDETRLDTRQTVYRIDRCRHCWDDFQDWCREVVWFGNKKGAYLHLDDISGEPGSWIPNVIK